MAEEKVREKIVGFWRDGDNIQNVEERGRWKLEAEVGWACVWMGQSGAG